MAIKTFRAISDSSKQFVASCLEADKLPSVKQEAEDAAFAAKEADATSRLAKFGISLEKSDAPVDALLEVARSLDLAPVDSW